MFYFVTPAPISMTYPKLLKPSSDARPVMLSTQGQSEDVGQVQSDWLLVKQSHSYSEKGAHWEIPIYIF